MFEKYQHVERYGTDEVEGIEDGTCWVFPKIDGTNASVWWDKGIKAGSRRRELTLQNDNHGFLHHISKDNKIIRLLELNPSLRIFGEWLVPHTLRTYRDDAWNKFYVFDVMEGKGYIPYSSYKVILDSFNVEYIPAIQKITKGDEMVFRQIADINDYLMKPGEIGEGVIIKRYGFVNRYGRTTWAKIVRSEFKERHYKEMRPPETKYTVERLIAATCVTKTLVDKEKAKIDTSPVQPRLLSTVYHCILTEELAKIIKKLKNPTIDFKVLNRYVTAKVKEHAKELF